MDTVTAYRISRRPLTSADCHSDHSSTPWDTCYDGWEGDVRSGLSCCASMDDLVAYFAHSDHGLWRAADLDGAVVTTLVGVLSDDDARDPGEILVHPTRILDNAPVTEFVELLRLEIESRNCYGDTSDDTVVFIADTCDFEIRTPCTSCDGSGEDDGEDCWECAGDGYVAR